MKPLDWHARYSQQAQWTQNLRRYLYGRANLASADHILEVGCGTGAVLMEMTMQTHGEVFGLDISNSHLAIAANNLPGIPLVSADAHDLPYPANTFDITLCHFLLLWIGDPEFVIQEMSRVTRPGGAIMALAEPDYGGRIDFPSELGILGTWQQASLREQGADPLTGRKLRAICKQAGLVDVETGLLGGQWAGGPHSEDWELEWMVLESDLQRVGSKISTDDLARLKHLDKKAWEQEERILFVPTFYAWGRKPHDSSISNVAI